MLKFAPSVFAVGDGYQIIINTEGEAFVDIKTGGRLFTDDSNGILRSASSCHKFNIPAELIEGEKGYTVGVTPVTERKAYFSVTEKRIEYRYSFAPLPDDNIRIYHIADTHNRVDEPVRACENYGKIDLLILNGDIPEDSETVSNFDTIYDICGRITGGGIPCVFARGNHDLRGRAAEFHSMYLPDCGGCSYYGFRAGRIRGLCLDCGEDKTDDHPEYGNTVTCHGFRERETEFIRREARNEADSSARDSGYKLVVVHVPFIHRYHPPFDIEEDIYREWAALLKDGYKPDLMLCGHEHGYRTVYPGDDYDDYGLPCPMLVGSYNNGGVIGGAGILLSGRSAEITLTDSTGITGKFEIKL